jgi:predicted RNase H-like HicB family nuclease
MNEIIFIVEEAPEGGYVARVPGQSIYSQAESIAELHSNVRDAVQCHFDEGERPSLIRIFG